MAAAVDFPDVKEVLSSEDILFDRLQDLRSGGVHRAQAGHRLLEDHRDVAPPDCPDAFAIGSQVVEDDISLLVMEDGAAGDDAPRFLDQLHGHNLYREQYEDDVQVDIRQDPSDVIAPVFVLQ